MTKFDLYDILYTFTVLGICHVLLLLINKYSTVKLKNKSIWFFLHFIGNFLAVIRAFGAVKYFVMKPVDTIFSQEDFIDTKLIILSMHLYHPIFFRMNNEDWFHHIFYVYIGTIFASIYKMGHFVSFYHLFSSGIPGGIIYLCLVLEDLHMITKVKRLHIASILNVWVRSLGLSICWVIRLLCFLVSAQTAPDWIALIAGFFLTIYNGQYYMEQVVRADESYNIKK